LADDLSETTLQRCRTQSPGKRSAPKRSFQRPPGNRPPTCDKALETLLNL
jgi:hypothetical protein